MISGGDILDFIRVATGTEKRPKKMNKLLQTYGDWNVSIVRVCRTPVQKGVQAALNLFTLGHWEKAKKKLQYDDIFHLYLILDLKDPNSSKIKRIRMELNQRLNIEENAKVKSSSSCIRTPIHGKIKLSELVSNAERADKNLYKWKPYHNCQVFVASILSGSGLYTDEVNKFVRQDVGELLPSSLLEKLVRGTVDTAALFSSFLE